MSVEQTGTQHRLVQWQKLSFQGLTTSPEGLQQDLWDLLLVDNDKKNLLFDRDSKEGLGLNTSCIKNTVYTYALISPFLSHTVTRMHTHTERTCHSVLSVPKKFIIVTALCIKQGGMTVLTVQPEQEPEIPEKSAENKKGYVCK